MNFFNSLLGKKPSSNLKLSKDASGEWVVKRGSSVLYIGSKEKCSTYIANMESN